MKLKQIREAPYADLDKVMSWDAKAKQAILDREGDIGSELANEIKWIASQDQDTIQGIIDLTRQVLNPHGLSEISPSVAPGSQNAPKESRPANEG